MGDFTHISDQHGVFALNAFSDQLFLDVPEVEGRPVHRHPLIGQLEIVEFITVVFVRNYFFSRIPVSSLPEYHR